MNSVYENYFEPFGVAGEVAFIFGELITPINESVGALSDGDLASASVILGAAFLNRLKALEVLSVTKTAAPIAISPTYSELKGITKGFQAHHIMPQYLGEMLGYTKKDMLDHPATAVTQWTHTGKLNPDTFHRW